jgi:hypothetical protein
MPSFSISHLSLLSWTGIAAVVVLFALLLLMRTRRQRREAATQPATAPAIAYQLGRIADALERLSASRETPPSEGPPLGGEKTLRHVSLSIFGR